MQEFWKIAITISGLGAVASFTLWSLYKQWLALPIFQTLTKEQLFSLFKLYFILTFLFALSALGVYVYIATVPSSLDDSSAMSPQGIKHFEQSPIINGSSHDIEFNYNTDVKKN